MDCAIVYSEPALADLREITAYIAKDNAEAAQTLCESTGGRAHARPITDNRELITREAAIN
jgi:plasmid stabilization system protein ParE